MNSAIKIFAAIVFFSVHALASIPEISGDGQAPVTEYPNLKAFVGFGGGNALLLEDGTLILTIRGGVSVNKNLRAGVWGSTVASDARNYDAPNHKAQYIDYNAAGAIAELQLFNRNAFSISIPLLVGCGYVNVQEEGVEDSQAKDGFFIAEAALHFNYQITKALQVAIGGGYRLFLGIDYENLENADFNTPFAEVVFYWSEK